jgi:hypothetical protein
MRSMMSTEAKEEALSAVAPFATLSAVDLAAVASRAEEGVFAPGAVLMREAQRSEPPTFVILSGEASATQGAGVMATVGPGTVLGPGAPQPALRAATVTALTLMHVLVLDGEPGGPVTNG